MTAQESNVALDVLCIALTIFWIVLILRVIVSLAILVGLRPPLYGPWRKALDLLDVVTEPVLRPLRALIPPIRAGTVGLDLSVMVAFVILAVLRIALEC